MQLTDQGNQRLDLAVAAAHLGVTAPPDDLYVRVYSISFRDEGRKDADFTVFVGRERIKHGDESGGVHSIQLEQDDDRWHISINGHTRPPAWNEIVQIAHRVRDGVCFVVGVPPRSWWINVAPNCIHLWEIADPNLTALWRDERQGHDPS